MVSGALVDLPGVRQLVQRQQDKLVGQIRRDVAAKAAAGGGAPPLRQLPAQGLAAAEVLERLSAKVRLLGLSRPSLAMLLSEGAAVACRFQWRSA